MLEVVVKGFHFLSEASRTNRFGLGCPLEKKVGFSEGLESSPLDSSLDFITWTIWILKCRTAFGFAVRRSFTAVGGAPLPPTAAFPLPIPYPTVWHGGGPGLSKLRFKKLAMKRLLNLVVLALDFQYLGRAPTAEEIGRCPNKWQVRCYDRLRTLLAACGTDPEPFPLAPGRSGPELGACLFQLEQFLAKPLLLERGYRERLGADFVDDPSIFPGALPAVEALPINGSGGWDMQAFIDDELWLPYVEPKFLLHEEYPDPGDVPSFANESYDENLQLITNCGTGEAFWSCSLAPLKKAFSARSSMLSRTRRLTARLVTGATQTNVKDTPVDHHLIYLKELYFVLCGSLGFHIAFWGQLLTAEISTIRRRSLLPEPRPTFCPSGLRLCEADFSLSALL